VPAATRPLAAAMGVGAREFSNASKVSARCWVVRILWAPWMPACWWRAGMLRQVFKAIGICYARLASL
jgi:hypothetical protein